MSLLTKAALLLAVAGSALGAPTNPGGFKTHVSATPVSNHVPGHGTHFQLPEHLKARNSVDSNSVNSIPCGEVPGHSTKAPEPQTLYTNHTYVPVEAYNNTNTNTVSKRNAAEAKKHIPMPHRSSTPYIDQATGITFQRFHDATSQFSFALALSSLPSASATGSTDPTDSLLGSSSSAEEEVQNDATDFIAQLSFPLNSTTGLGRGAGWGGISISSKLTASHLPLFLGIQTDGFGNLAFSSFTETVASTGDAAPTTAGQQATSTGKDLSFKIRTIESATSINSTFLTYTFLCEGCLSISKCAANLQEWKSQGKTKVLRLGWATGDTIASGAETDSPDTPDTPDSPDTGAPNAEQEEEPETANQKKFAYHRLGFGHMKIDLEGALHTAEEFSAWKGLAMTEEVRGFEGVAPPFALDLVNGESNSEGASNLEKTKGGDAEKEEEGVEEVESESASDSDSDSDSDCGCESDSDSDSDSDSEDEE